MADWVCTRTYRQWLERWRAADDGARPHAAHKLADAFMGHGEPYHALTWLLVAHDLGDEEAGDRIEALELAEDVGDEDRILGHLQIALWAHRGVHQLAFDAARTLRQLEAAAHPFLDDLPSDQQIANHDDVVAFRDAAWRRSLRNFGFPPPGATPQRGHVTTILDRMLAIAGWTNLDVSLPLGPAHPDRPYWLHPRHVLALEP